MQTYLPVETPQLRRHALLGGTAGSIFTTWAMSTTVYSLKLDTYMKWYNVSPLRSVNLLVLSLCVQGETSKGSLEHRLLLVDLQSTHSPQSGIKIGMTVSPSVTPSTSSPMLSTILKARKNQIVKNTGQWDRIKVGQNALDHEMTKRKKWRGWN